MRISALFIALFVLFATPSFACSCLGYDTLAEHWEATDVIFEGTALRTVREGDEGGFRRMTTFHVVDGHKGNLPDTISVLHSDPEVCCICGVGFEPGERYLVFAFERSDGRLSTGLCSSPRGTLEDYLNALARQTVYPVPDALDPTSDASGRETQCLEGENLTNPQ